MNTSLSLLSQQKNMFCLFEQKRFEGTKVTVESFLKWKAAFDKEMLELKRSKAEKSDKKLTGKQQFERDENLYESDLQMLNEEAIEVDESLFQNLDDLDLDDDGEEWVPGDDDDDDEEEEEEEEQSSSGRGKKKCLASFTLQR